MELRPRQERNGEETGGTRQRRTLGRARRTLEQRRRDKADSMRAARATTTDEQRRTNAERMRGARETTTDEQRAAQRRTNADSMRTARATRTTEQRAAQRRTNAESMRTARATRTIDQRAAQRRTDADRMRAGRAETTRQATQARAWQDLKMHRTPYPQAIHLGPTHACPHCGAVLLSEEESSFCCRGGKIQLPPLPDLPRGWQEIYQRPAFKHASRRYNSLFCFTAMGVSGEEGFMQQGQPSCVKIHGRTYHRVLPANMRGPVAWYVHDPDERRLDAEDFHLDLGTVSTIQQTLMDINPYARALRQLGQVPAARVNLHLMWNDESSEIAAVINRGEAATDGGPRTIVYWKRSESQPTFIDPLHPLYEPLQYPLFYPCGTPGWHIDLHSLNPPYAKISQIEFYRERVLKEARFGMLGRLLNEYLVDMFSSVEDNRLRYIRFQIQPRIAARREIDETINAEGGARAGRVYLPASHMGSPRMQRKLIADGLAIVRSLGKPTYFITVTCNPNWPEIQNHPGMEGQCASDRPDVTCRVFHAKLKLILKELRQGLLGRKVFVLSVIEFQKRGLPHAHIALRVEPQPETTDQIDQVISAEIPPEADGPDEERYRQVVLRHMLHRHRTDSAPCMDADGHCRKDFPKSLVETTYVDERGYVHYRRRQEDDCWVVPHNRQLLLLADSHVNMEISCTVNLIMYLYKYIFKGPDRARYTLGDETDEIAQYINARYLSASEAAWRIFGFHLNQREPSVKALPIHLPAGEYIVFREGSEMEALMASVSELDRYLCRPEDARFDDVQYCKYFEQYMVAPSLPTTVDTYWRDTVPGKEKYVYQRLRGETICRINLLYPSSGDVFYLKLLLLHSSPRSFQQARTIDGTVYTTFQEAARALGLLDDQAESELCFDEAVSCGFSPAQLRCLLVTLTMDGAPATALLESHADILMADFAEEARISTHTAWNRCLRDLSNRLETLGRSMSDFGLPEPMDDSTEVAREGLRWDRRCCQEFVDAHLPLLTADEQRMIFDEVLEAVQLQRPLLMYVDGRSGRGKTLLMKVITAAVRAQGKIVLCSATTGLAALNHEGGGTAHSTYKIPVTGDQETPQCSVTAHSQRADLLRNAAVHIWDEFPMTHRKNFEAVSQCLCDITECSTPCGGKIFLCCGNFRQIPPVIPGGSRADIVQASIKSSALWPAFTVRNLTHPQRDAEDGEYSRFIDDIGDNQLPASHVADENTGLIQLHRMAATTSEDAAIAFVYPNINDVYTCSERAIVTGTNKVVDELNRKILNQLDGRVVSLYSVTRLPIDGQGQLQNYLTEEFLTSLKSQGVPDHELKLKLNCLCMVMRNISVQDRLMNNSRVIVREIGRKLVTVETLPDHRRLVIPRIVFRFTLPRSGLTIERRQFPLRLCYAITVNKSQGQTLSKVCLDLRDHPFAHGQLYVGASRVRNRNDILVLTRPDHLQEERALTKNVVFEELLPS